MRKIRQPFQSWFKARRSFFQAGRMSKYSRLWQTITGGIKNTSGKKETENGSMAKTVPETTTEKSPVEPRELLARLCAYLVLPDAPDARLSPNWLSAKLQIGEFEMLDALAYALRDGLAELHWEVHKTARTSIPSLSKKL